MLTLDVIHFVAWIRKGMRRLSHTIDHAVSMAFIPEHYLSGMCPTCPVPEDRAESRGWIF